jgi:hypothetical protein
MNKKPTLSLDQQLAQLPRAIAPARDLWPGIEACLKHDAAIRERHLRGADARSTHRRRNFALGLAAGLAAIAIALIATLHPRGLIAPLAVQADGGAPRSPAFLRTRNALEQTYSADLQRLPRQTQARLVKDLEIIRNARADIRSALAASPQDPLLNELLADTWQQEMDFYANVSSTTDSARVRWPL